MTGFCSAHQGHDFECRLCTKGAVSQIESWVTEGYGEKCPDYEESCAVCQAWKAAEEFIKYMRVCIDKDKFETNMQWLVDQAQELDMGYGPTKYTRPQLSEEEKQLARELEAEENGGG